MATTADKLILAIAEKAGIPASDPDIIKVLSHTELNRIEVSDNLERSMQQNLLSIDDAKNNHPRIKGHYYGEAMSNVDRALSAAYKDAGFTDEEINSFNEEKSSTLRIPKVIAALKTKMEAVMEEAKKTAGKGGNTDALTQQINDLNNQLSTLKQSLSDKEKEYSTNINNIKIDTALGSKFAIKTVYDNLPGDVRETTLRTLLNKEIQDNGAQIVLDENGSLQLIKKDGSNYFDENNKQMTVDSFIEKSFAKNKILPQNSASSGGANGAAKGEQQQIGQPNNVSGGQQKNDYSGLYNKTLESLNNAPPVIV